MTRIHHKNWVKSRNSTQGIFSRLIHAPFDHIQWGIYHSCYNSVRQLLEVAHHKFHQTTGVPNQTSPFLGSHDSHPTSSHKYRPGPLGSTDPCLFQVRLKWPVLIAGLHSPHRSLCQRQIIIHEECVLDLNQKNKADPVKVPSELGRISGKISRKPYIIIINNTLRSSKIFIAPPSFAKLLVQQNKILI